MSDRFLERLWENAGRSQSYAFPLRTHTPGAPPTSRTSHFHPSLSAGAYHRVNEDVKRARQLVGTGVFMWPSTPRANWAPALREARSCRESALRALLADIGQRAPHLRSYTSEFYYQPEAFDSNQMHQRGASEERQVGNRTWRFSVVNDSAFDSVNSLHRTARHEIWHRLQYDHPQIYSSQPLREFDAHLRDLEHRRVFDLPPAEKFFSLQEATRHYQTLTRPIPHWNRLSQVQRDNFSGRYQQVRDGVCRELADSPFRTHPAYSRICGPQPGSLRWIGQGMGR